MLKEIFFNKKLLAIALLSLGLGACSSTDEEDEATKVAELTEINAVFEADVLWEMQAKKAYRDCENNVTTKYGTYYDIYFKVNSEGRAIDIEWYPDTNDGGCIKSFLKNYEFPNPPTTMPLWLQMYPGEI